MESPPDNQTEDQPKVMLNLVVIRSSDIERAAQFYRRLGVTFVKHRHGSGLEHYAVELGPMVFEIYPRNEDDGSNAVRLGFRVDDVEIVMNNLRATGTKIVSEPKASPWGRRAVAEDPDGHRVELTERGTTAEA
jgi:lactoylglutathione lyase